jgi:L-lactate dehydrogenase (cytochrome)
VQADRRKSEQMLARINRLADMVKFVCVTLDASAPGKCGHDERAYHVAATELPVGSAVLSAADAKPPSSSPSAPAWGGLRRQLFAGASPTLTWDNTPPWLARHTSMPILLKGIQTHEDPYLASLHAPQVRAVVLLNHGGRALDTAPPALHTLLEIRRHCPEVAASSGWAPRASAWVQLLFGDCRRPRRGGTHI